MLMIVCRKYYPQGDNDPDGAVPTMQRFIDVPSLATVGVEKVETYVAEAYVIVKSAAAASVLRLAEYVQPVQAVKGEIVPQIARVSPM